MFRCAYLTWMPPLAALLWTLSAEAAGQYAIIAPIEGAVISPGQRIEIVVQGPPAKGIVISGIAWVDDRIIAPPLYKYYIVVPSNVPAGGAKIQAIIQPEVGPVETISLGLKIQPDLSNANLVISPPENKFTFIGQMLYVSAQTVDRLSGAQSDLGDVGSDLSATPSDSSIVQVAAGGAEVIAAKSGATYVAYSYRGLASTLLIDVEISPVPGDLNGDGVVDRFDVAIVQDRVGLPKAVPNDSRDINQDGKIDALDLRVLTSMCSKPRCAS